MRRGSNLASVTRLPQRSQSDTAKQKRSAERRMKDLVQQRAHEHNDGMCEVCRREYGREVAHRQAKGGRGGEHRASNALYLCHDCHAAQRDGRGGEELATQLGQVLPSMIGGEKPNPAVIPVYCVYGRVLLDDLGGWRQA